MSLLLMIKNTMLESAIERRNYYQALLIEDMVNVIYFDQKVKESEPDSPERMNAKTKVTESQKNVDAGNKLMKVFDLVIEEIGKKAKVGVVTPITNQPK
jgi:hypothetical protein